MPILSPADRASLPTSLPLWRILPDRDAIARDFSFADFSTAWGVMSRIALLAERLDHHPEWSNTYNRLRIVLTSHESGGVSAKDLEMARAIDALASVA